MNRARVLQVIETTLLRRGKGKEEDPVRIIRQYWDFDGNLLAEVDPWNGDQGLKLEDMIRLDEGRK